MRLPDGCAGMIVGLLFMLLLIGVAIACDNRTQEEIDAARGKPFLVEDGKAMCWYTDVTAFTRKLNCIPLDAQP